MVHRCAPEIRLAILDLCREKPRSKTDIVYMANLNFRNVNEFLDDLLGLELVEMATNGTQRRYSTTQKGITAAGRARASGIVCEEAKA
jgi:predicted transcriptional regulator